MNNTDLFSLSKELIPGGVNSPVRSFNSVGGTPFFTDRAEGCVLYDVEGNEYIDYVCSWGANITGHANRKLITAVSERLSKGFSYGTPTELEYIFASKVKQLQPLLEEMRLVSSGTEAVMSAIRLARGYTKRKYIIKFNGCYHGHSDALLIKAGSGLLTFNSPSSSGVTEESVQHTLVLEYNDINMITEAFTLYGNEIAAVLIEPIAVNMNFVRPSQEFLVTIRNLCTKHNSVLIFDEVMTGFRIALGGASEVFGVKPDLITLGKVIGGGMPLALFGGRSDIMQCLSPVGSVYQAGTLSGNPIAVAAGLANLEIVSQAGFYTELNTKIRYLLDGIQQAAIAHNIDFCYDSEGGMFGFYFTDKLPSNFNQVKAVNQAYFNRFFHLMLDNGVYLAPSLYEAGFICSMHSYAALDKTIEVAKKVFTQL